MEIGRRRLRPLAAPDEPEHDRCDQDNQNHRNHEPGAQ